MTDFKDAKYSSLKENILKCSLCPHNCTISEGKTGICGVRVNLNGRLFTKIFGEITAIAMDPIEKKPLYHFYPGSQILSIGTKGCNLKCPFCQNWNISQDLSVRTRSYQPEEIVKLAIENNSIGIAYTYNEPFIWFEYVLETAKLAKKNGLKNVMVSNGFVNYEPLNELINYIDGINIDLKSFREDTYKKVLKAKLHNVIDTIKFVYNSNVHLEITTLIVTGMNDNLDEMTDICQFISSIDKNIPWHISRYYPNYKYTDKATEIAFMMNVHDVASNIINYVYCGNIPSNYSGNNTVCPSCKETIIKRNGYLIDIVNLDNGKCSNCKNDLNILC